MKLLTHNFLSSKFLKEAENGYPLKLRCNTKEKREVEFNKCFMQNILPKLDLGALRLAAESVGEGEVLPAVFPEDIATFTEQDLENIHKVLVCVEIVDGELECPDTGRIFPIKDGIPNMLVEDEKE